ncbi:hypothetical protein CS390_15200 [Pseudomonas sp. HLS-6]|uniref:hypothetical protein n=1 Tax=Pseudomonas sp. HLS-6 TaxID=2049589 RepID=UPI000C1A72A7|nr:hypothetical protein [Pseudomonas sp. HLS-6]ATR83792.1 hypothetical protein CS390_15200 [Pseudomonas sp. HLS-6]
MKKSPRPEFSRQLMPLTACPECRGQAAVNGLYGPRPCMACNVSGWVDAGTGEALPLEELVTQLSLRLQAAQRYINELKHPRATGPEALYTGSNRRGAGGANFTGD